MVYSDDSKKDSTLNEPMPPRLTAVVWDSVGGILTFGTLQTLDNEYYLHAAAYGLLAGATFMLTHYNNVVASELEEMVDEV